MRLLALSLRASIWAFSSAFCAAFFALFFFRFDLFFGFGRQDWVDIWHGRDVVAGLAHVAGWRHRCRGGVGERFHVVQVFVR